MTGHETTGRTDRTFARRLDRLKQRGCNLLIASDVESEASICRRSLGHPAEPRRHLFVPTTTTLRSVLDHHGRPCDRSTLGIVDATAATATRSGATVQRVGDVDPTAEWYDSVDSLDPAELGTVAMAHLDRLATFTSAPGELRLCVESLDPFLGTVDEERLFDFLHLLTARVRDLRGMGHFHVAAEPSLDPLAPYRSLFDATVVARSTADGPRERWILHDSGYDTGWIRRPDDDRTI